MSRLPPPDDEVRRLVGAEMRAIVQVHEAFDALSALPFPSEEEFNEREQRYEHACRELDRIRVRKRRAQERETEALMRRDLPAMHRSLVRREREAAHRSTVRPRTTAVVRRQRPRAASGAGSSGEEDDDAGDGDGDQERAVWEAERRTMQAIVILTGWPRDLEALEAARILLLQARMWLYEAKAGGG